MSLGILWLSSQRLCDGMLIVSICCRATCLVSNRKREARNGVVKPEDMHFAPGDLTDGQNEEFRYTY